MKRKYFYVILFIICSFICFGIYQYFFAMIETECIKVKPVPILCIENVDVQQNSVPILRIENVDVQQNIDHWQIKISFFTTYPNSSILALKFLCVDYPQEYCISENSVQVQQESSFCILGSYKQKIRPGKYRIVLYFAPQMQLNPMMFGFQKTQYEWQQGTEIEYQKILEQECYFVEAWFENIQQEQKNILASIQNNSMQEHQVLYREKIQQFRKQEQYYINQYIVPMFFHLKHDWFSLINILEDEVEEQTDYHKEFLQIFEFSYFQYRKEVMQISLTSKKWMLEDIEKIQKQLKCFRSKDIELLSPEDYLILADYLYPFMELESSMQMELQNSMQNNKKIDEMYQNIQEMYLKVRHNTTGAVRQILYFFISVYFQQFQNTYFIAQKNIEILQQEMNTLYEQIKQKFLHQQILAKIIQTQIQKMEEVLQLSEEDVDYEIESQQILFVQEKICKLETLYDLDKEMILNFKNLSLSFLSILLQQDKNQEQIFQKNKENMLQYIHTHTSHIKEK